MNVQSRATLPYQCNQVLHPWSEHCLPAALSIAKPCFRESFKIYCVLYGVTGLIKLRKVKTLEDLRKALTGTVIDTLRSTVFLGLHGFLFMPSACVGRQIFGHISYYKLYFQTIFTTLTPILIERKNRRGALALYMANLAVEVLFKMAVQRKIITPLHNGEVLLFAIASAIYTFILKTTAEHKHNAFLFSAIRMLIGKEECAPVLTIETPSKKFRFLTKIINYFARIKQQHIFQNRNHAVCKHQYHCLIHILSGFAKRFSVGVIIQLILHLTKSPFQYFKHPLSYFRSLNRSTLSLGLFFGFYSGIYRLISCLLRNILKYDRPEHGLVAGYFAGFSMLFFKSSTIAMYMMAKLIESIYFRLAHNKKLPLLPWFDSVLYALSTALVFHSAVIEPQVIRPAYYKFLLRLTGNHLVELNRPMMDCYGVCSSKLFPNYKPPTFS